MTQIPTVLAFNPAAAKLPKLRVLCLRMGLRLQTVPPEDWGETLSALAGETERTGAPAAERVEGEMLVMAHFPDGLLDAFLNAFRQMRIPPVALKAMLTETNAGWTPPELFREIRSEHDAMRRR